MEWQARWYRLSRPCVPRLLWYEESRKGVRMFRVFEVPRSSGEGKSEKGYQIFWCPSAPLHYADKIPHDEKVYAHKQAAYRRKKQLEELAKAAS